MYNKKSNSNEDNILVSTTLPVGVDEPWTSSSCFDIIVYKRKKITDLMVGSYSIFLFFFIFVSFEITFHVELKINFRKNESCNVSTLDKTLSQTNLNVETEFIVQIFHISPCFPWIVCFWGVTYSFIWTMLTENWNTICLTTIYIPISNTF